MDRPRTYDDISPPSRTLSRLEAHHYAAVAKSRGPWEREYDSLITEFAWWNEMKRTESGFSFVTLATGTAPKRADDSHSMPGMDHVQYFRRGRRPVAILTEPYDPEHYAAGLRDHVEGLGLIIHSPPNLYASLHFPGWTGSFLVTRPDFGRVLWLEDQLMFETQGLVT